MYFVKSPIRILFNDSHINFPGNKFIPEGGPSRFVDLFTKYFEKTPHHLTSVFFSHNPKNTDVKLRKILSRPNHDYFDMLYHRESLTKTYNQTFTKKKYIKYLSPWLEQTEKLFDECRPQILFLNGYKLTSYLLLITAKKRGIPVCIQHAGIWKKEILVSSGSVFSPSIIKIFASLEKDITKNKAHHIFLNEFSKDSFLSEHNLQKNDLYESSIIALPLPIPKKVYPFVLSPKSKKNLSIGAVARWDAIKNHGALLRLGEYIKTHQIPATVSVVTNPFNKISSEFRKKYVEYVKAISPMNQKKLRAFYLKCDIVLIPSQFDVSPTVLMESIFLGVPVVISDLVGWVSYYKKLGLQSLVISPDASGQKIFNTLNQLFINPDRYIKKFTKLQKMILQKHSPGEIFPKYEKIFINLSKEKIYE